MGGHGVRICARYCSSRSTLTTRWVRRCTWCANPPGTGSNGRRWSMGDRLHHWPHHRVHHRPHHGRTLKRRDCDSHPMWIQRQKSGAVNLPFPGKQLSPRVAGDRRCCGSTSSSISSRPPRAAVGPVQSTTAGPDCQACWCFASSFIRRLALRGFTPGP